NDPEKAVRMSHEIQRMMPDLVVVEQVLEAARQWGPGSTLNHVPAARFEPGASRLWSVPPTKILFEFFREDWQGWP
nr:hypothetical protein [bacterium]